MSREENNDFWLSLDQYHNRDEFVEKFEREFKSSPLKEKGTEVDRRNFMKLMGASIAMSTAGCLNRPVQKIIPYNKRPPEIIPGIANYYASSFFDGLQGMGMLVKTREGRPIFVSGNEEHPGGAGLTPVASAIPLSLYDPDRLRAPVRHLHNPARTNREEISANWDQIDKKVAANLSKGGVRVLTGLNPSPSANKLIDQFLSVFGGEKIQWSPVNYNSILESHEACLGKKIIPNYRFDKAKLVISIDCDFMGAFLSSPEFSSQFSKGRNPDGEMNRLVCFSSALNLTSLNADDRFLIKPSQQLAVVMGLIAKVIASSGVAVDKNVGKVFSSYVNIAETLGFDKEKFDELGKELSNNFGSTLVVAGGSATQTDQSYELNVAVNFLNYILGSYGTTVNADVRFTGLFSENEKLEKLLLDMESGSVNTLIIDQSINIGLTYPDQIRLKDAINKVDLVLYTGNHLDNTALLSDYVIPGGHPFEYWNDFKFKSNLYSLQQPTISPLFDTRSLYDSLLVWMNSKSDTGFSDYHDFIKDAWKGESEDSWNTLLKLGYSLQGQDPITIDFKFSSLEVLPSYKKHDGIEFVSVTTTKMLLGQYANNAWLQELPDPVTKIVWDNYAMISPALAKNSNLEDGNIIKLEVNGASFEIPVLIVPATHPNVIAVPLGYGQDLKALKVANNVGVNVFNAGSASKNSVILSGLSASLNKTTKNYTLASTQGHNYMKGRQLVVDYPLESYKNDKNAGIHRHKFTKDIWTPHQYNKNKWGMSIDLNSCIGCSSCMVACQSENNIPVVGKKYVLEGREMHWIRIDRYWRGPTDNPDALMQPVMCQHCENAPCERVCPVLATVHSDEGLNDMVYNRCVGTRYCSNNCPYKVRRFNWFNYSSKYKEKNDTTHMALNPEVTVRSRGVMEKCTFCVQRIKEGKNTAKDKKQPLKDGEIKTACQSVCPTNAINFGDLNDKESVVAENFEKERSYMLLEEQNTRARVRYLAKIRNGKREVKGHHGDDHGTDHDSKQGGGH